MAKVIKATSKATNKASKPAPKVKEFGGFEVASVVARKVKGITTTVTEGGQLRVSGTYGMCPLIKWATVMGYSRKQTAVAVELLTGVTPNPTTLGCHRTAGEFMRQGKAAPHHNGPIANVSKADAAKVLAKCGKPEGEGPNAGGKKLLADASK